MKSSAGDMRDCLTGSRALGLRYLPGNRFYFEDEPSIARVSDFRKSQSAPTPNSLTKPPKKKGVPHARQGTQRWPRHLRSVAQK
jgi:hypothetical protein